MAIGISAVCHQATADGAVRVQERRVGTLDQVPRQGACAARRIEPALRLHDDAPSQALAGLADKSRHDTFLPTRGAGPTATVPYFFLGPLFAIGGFGPALLVLLPPFLDIVSESSSAGGLCRDRSERVTWAHVDVRDAAGRPRLPGRTRLV